MAIAPSAVEEVKQEIEKFLRQLKLGMDEVVKLTKKIMEALHQNENLLVTSEGLRNNKDIQKEVRNTCLFHLLQKDSPTNLLSKTPDELQKNELKNTFKDFLKKMFKLTPKNKKKLDPNKEQEETIDQLAETLQTELTKNKEDVQLVNNKQAMGVIAGCVDALTASIETDYGVDIRETGRLAKPITSTPVEVNTQNLARADGSSSRASQLKESGDDPMGIKILNILGDIADGNPAISIDQLQKVGIFDEPGFNPHPLNTRPKPPGVF